MASESINQGARELSEKITVAMVEDNVDFAHTVRDFLAKEGGFELVGMDHDEKGFQRTIANQVPDIALVDLGLSKPDSGIELIRWLASDYPAVKPIVLTTDENAVLRCYQIGARGYVLKGKLEVIGRTLRSVQAGELIIPPDVGALLVKQTMDEFRTLRRTIALGNLSDRENELLGLLRSGLSREVVAERMGISFFTVRRHVQNVLEKTGKHSLAEVMETVAGS